MLNQDFFNDLYTDLSRPPHGTDLSRPPHGQKSTDQKSTGQKFLEKYGIIDGNDLMIKLTTYRTKKDMYMDLRNEYPLLPLHKQELDKFFEIPGTTNTLTEKKATYCGRCGHTHVKGTPCPRPFKEAEMTDKYDDAPELKGGQKKLPDNLQKAIIDKVVGKLKEAEVSPAEKAAKDAEVKALQARKKAIDDELGRIQKTGLTEGMGADYEGKMAKAQLISIVKNAKDLFDSMDDNTQLKSWIQSKLTKAEDYISSVRTYLDGESLSTTTPLVHDGEPVRDDEGAALNIGDVVKAADGKIYQVVFSYSEGKPFLTPFDLKRRKPTNLRERHYFDNVSEEMNKSLKMSKVMEAGATKGGFMR